MKPVSDLFSENSSGYQKYRPEYPHEFLKEIVSMTRKRECCWDCGTGNGQVAVVLSKFFRLVEATDISADQLKMAPSSENIQYTIGRAEERLFPDDHFDLITVAQAAHWFDLPNFFDEVRRVAKNNGVLALWGYGLLRFENELDPVIDWLYQYLQPYWNIERKHIDKHYESIPFPFEEVSVSKPYSIRWEFRREELMGYLNTWSAVRNCRKSTNNDPLTEFAERISGLWKSKEEPMVASFPIFTKIGRVSK